MKKHTLYSKGGQSYLKINSDEALSNESLTKCNGNEVLNDGFS
jgi:hypothetical protein